MLRGDGERGHEREPRGRLAIVIAVSTIALLTCTYRFRSRPSETLRSRAASTTAIYGTPTDPSSAILTQVG